MFYFLKQRFGLYVPAMLELKPKAPRVLDKHSTVKLSPQPRVLIIKYSVVLQSMDTSKK